MTEGPHGPATAAEVEETIRALYRALGDRPAFDAHLDPNLTIWESDAEDLLVGLSALDTLRDERARTAASAPLVSSVAPEAFVVDVWGPTAVARFLLRVRHADDDAPDVLFRVTDVLRADDDRWRLVHHHAERRPG